ncbi:Leucine-rich repeat receptor-like tyrosine-protein kinase pxc3, partial [Sarracenia purpurea var. burkii]
ADSTELPTRLTYKDRNSHRSGERLAFLHHVAIIYLDISSISILFYSNFGALIGEIEILKLLDPSRDTASICAVAGSFGYIPR